MEMFTSGKFCILAYGAFKFLNGIIIVYQVFNRNNMFVFVLFLRQLMDYTDYVQAADMHKSRRG